MRLALLGIGLVLFLAGAVLADAYYQAYTVYRDLKKPVASIAAVRASMAKGTVPSNKAAASLRDSARALGQEEGMRLTFRLTGAIPFLRRPVDAVRRGRAAVREGTQAASLAVDMLRDVVGDAASAAPTSSSSKGSGPLIQKGTVDLDSIQALEPRLEMVRRHLRAAIGHIRAIPSVPFLPQVDRFRARALDQSAAASRLAERMTLGIRLVPSFLGATGSRTYLLAMQNNAELKATGGALLAYGFLEVTNGRLKLIHAGSLVEIDRKSGFEGVRLPPSLQWYIDRARAKQNGRPRIAIANLSPDFPAVAQGWSSLISKATGQRIDGVLALDPVAISYLLGGNQIRVPSYPGRITAKNVVKVIEHDQYRLPLLQQRLFTDDLIRAAWPILSNPQPLVPTIRKLGVALSEKHLQLWSAEANEQALLGRLGWDGALRVNPGDYLFAVNNQARGSKLDYFVHTRIQCDVSIGGAGGAHSTCQVRLTNKTPPGQPPVVLGKGRRSL